MIELYKDGDSMAIVTDAKDEDEFIRQISNVLGDLADGDKFRGDWEFQFNYWLHDIVNICCKYRGYKNNVVEKRVLVSGSTGCNKQDLVSSTAIIEEKYSKAKELINDQPTNA